MTASLEADSVVSAAALRDQVGERWSDLAIASWSLAWNRLADADPAFWDAYGVQPDAERISMWRARWDAPAR